MTDAENDLHQSTQFMFKNPQSKTDYTGQQFSKQDVTCVHHAKSFTNQNTLTYKKEDFLIGTPPSTSNFLPDNIQLQKANKKCA